MKAIAVDPIAPSEEDLRRTVALLRRGGVIAFPTETFYGLGVDPFDTPALERLYRIKEREAGKPLGLVAAGVEQLALVTPRVPELAIRLGEVFWPGPLSMIFEASPRLPWPSVAVRVSSLPWARALPAALGLPITATSANKGGAPPAVRLSELDPELAEALDLCIDGGEVPGGVPSTMVDVRGDRPELVRAGRVDFEEIRRAHELS